MSAEQQPQPREPWHPQDIIAAVRKRGSSLQRLGRERGFGLGVLNRATTKRFPRAHQIIAEFIGVPRQEIWPQFYDETGAPRSFLQVRADKARAA